MVALVPPNFRRYLPFVLIAIFALFLVPTLLRKKSATGPSASTRAQQTIAAMNLIDKGEQAYMNTHGRFTPHIADLLTTTLADDLAIGITVHIDVSSDGSRYLAQVESDVLSLIRGRNKARIVAQSCLQLSKAPASPAHPQASNNRASVPAAPIRVRAHAPGNRARKSLGATSYGAVAPFSVRPTQAKARSQGTRRRPLTPTEGHTRGSPPTPSTSGAAGHPRQLVRLATKLEPGSSSDWVTLSYRN